MTRLSLLMALATVGCSERALPFPDSVRNGGSPDLAGMERRDAGQEGNDAAVHSPDLAQPPEHAIAFSDAILGGQLVGQPWSITVADVDHDGHPDALVGTDQTAGILYGKGDGTFSSFEEWNLYNSHEVIAADLDGDGWEELVVAQA